MARTNRADYGIDAPLVLRNLIVVGLIAILAAACIHRAAPSRLDAAVGLAHLGAWFLGSAFVMYTGSRWGKLRARDALLRRLDLRGGEHVLDVGCGHGLLLIGAAKRLPDGRAVGIDLWSQED